MTASAPKTRARPRYSDNSNGPMAFTIQSYLMAETNAIVLPASSAHQAQRSPRRNAVAVMRLSERVCVFLPGDPDALGRLPPEPLQLSRSNRHMSADFKCHRPSPVMRSEFDIRLARPRDEVRLQFLAH